MLNKLNKFYSMREWLSWWSTTLPRLGSRVRVPSRAFLVSGNHFRTFFTLQEIPPVKQKRSAGMRMPRQS